MSADSWEKTIMLSMMVMTLVTTLAMKKLMIMTLI